MNPIYSLTELGQSHQHYHHFSTLMVLLVYGYLLYFIAAALTITFLVFIILQSYLSYPYCCSSFISYMMQTFSVSRVVSAVDRTWENVWWGNDPWVLDISLPSLRPRKDIYWKDIKAHKHYRLAWPRSKTWHTRQGSKRPSRIMTCLGFIQTDFICNLLGEQSRDPTFAYKRLGGRSSSG
jgi:hypothetical protein